MEKVQVINLKAERKDVVVMKRDHGRKASYVLPEDYKVFSGQETSNAIRKNR